MSLSIEDLTTWNEAEIITFAWRCYEKAKQLDAVKHYIKSGADLAIVTKYLVAMENNFKFVEEEIKEFLEK